MSTYCLFFTYTCNSTKYNNNAGVRAFVRYNVADLSIESKDSCDDFSSTSARSTSTRRRSRRQSWSLKLQRSSFLEATERVFATAGYRDMALRASQVGVGPYVAVGDRSSGRRSGLSETESVGSQFLTHDRHRFMDDDRDRDRDRFMDDEEVCNDNDRFVNDKKASRAICRRPIVETVTQTHCNPRDKRPIGQLTTGVSAHLNGTRMILTAASL